MRVASGEVLMLKNGLIDLRIVRYICKKCAQARSKETQSKNNCERTVLKHSEHISQLNAEALKMLSGRRRHTFCEALILPMNITNSCMRLVGAGVFVVWRL